MIWVVNPIKDGALAVALLCGLFLAFCFLMDWLARARQRRPRAMLQKERDLLRIKKRYD
jgi:hypothetical protein